jgi:hypothetical protein
MIVLYLIYTISDIFYIIRVFKAITTSHNNLSLRLITLLNKYFEV